MLPVILLREKFYVCEVSEAIALIWIVLDCSSAGLGWEGMTTFHQMMILRYVRPESKLKSVDVVVNKITILMYLALCTSKI